MVIDALGIRHDTVDITPMVDPLFERFPDVDSMLVERCELC